MNLTNLQDEVELALRRSPSGRVIYLEGKDDVDFLFALLGKQTPISYSDKSVVYQDTLVKGLTDKGSGAKAVKARVNAGTQLRKQGLVYGIIDGDGLELNTLAECFDAPYSGPLFCWKAYCIENLLAKTGWPPDWGAVPNWRAELSSYGPYVALNRVGLQVRTILEQLGLMNYRNPDGPLKTPSDFADALAAGKNQLMSFDVVHRFADELSNYQDLVRRDLDEAHAFFQGKWLIDHLAPRISGRNNAKQCKAEWLAHSISVGGLPEVRDWWKRVTGSAP